MRSRVLEQAQYFTGPSVAVELRFLEDRGAIAMHLKAPAFRRNERDLGLGKLGANLGRQTGSPWFVVSKRAELDGNGHGRLKGML
jgi:hypothetical protein